MKLGTARKSNLLECKELLEYGLRQASRTIRVDEEVVLLSTHLLKGEEGVAGLVVGKI